MSGNNIKLLKSDAVLNGVRFLICITLILTVTVLCVSCSVSSDTKSKRNNTMKNQIGTYYPDTLNGMMMSLDNEHAVVLSIGWFVSGELKDGYRNLLNSDVRLGNNSADWSVNQIDWEAENGRIYLDWGKISDKAVYLTVRSDREEEIAVCLSKGWTDMKDFTVKTSTTDNNCMQTAVWQDIETVFNAMSESKESNTHDGYEKDGYVCYRLAPNKPLRLVAGMCDVSGIDFGEANDIYTQSILKYESNRAKSTGDLGDFIGPILKECNTSRLTHPSMNLLTSSVVRSWCLPDTMRIFCWDNMFIGLLNSLEDKESAYNAVRGVIYAKGEEGNFPNVGYELGCGTEERSQPPVWSMCVYKIYQRQGEKDFLREVYPSLKEAHDWWFKTNPKTDLPFRDGNLNGLLEWGSGNQQDAKFETGMDDSPMYHEIEMNSVTGTMRLDDVGLNSMYAMDAHYLSLIAGIIGEKDDKAVYADEFIAMRDKINDFFWDEKAGVYCNRYEEERYETYLLEGETIPAAMFETVNGAKGITGEYFDDSDLNVPLFTRIDENIYVDSEDEALRDAMTSDEFAVRWSGFLCPEESGEYAFEMASGAGSGIRITIGGKTYIDVWGMLGIKTEYRTPPIKLTEGERVPIIIECRKGMWSFKSIGLEWYKVGVNGEEKSVFSKRLTPTNFYPLILNGVPQERVDRMLAVLDEKFGGGNEFMCPTAALDDPAFIDQQYWRGKIWAPTNYLLWLGLKNYCDDAYLWDYASRSINLFMKNWNETGTCHENYFSDGNGSSESHYVWGALLPLIGIEYFKDIADDGSIVNRSAPGIDVTIENIFICGAKTF